MFELLRRVFSPTARIESRLARIEHKLDILLAHTGAISHPMPRGVIQLLRDGRKREAVRVYCDARGVSQHDAELAVEAYIQASRQ